MAKSCQWSSGALQTIEYGGYHQRKGWRQKKTGWKRIIGSALEDVNKKELKEAITPLEKLKVMKEEEYGRKDYFHEMSLNESLLFFRIRTRMIRCKMNQSSDSLNKASLWRCEDCGYVDSQSHIIHCPAYQEFREGKSLNSDSEMVEYSRKVLKIREDRCKKS